MEPAEKVTLTNMCMVYDNHGNVLVEEKTGRDYKGLIFPGGHVEKFEPFTDAVIREIYEETGLTISNVQLCGIKDWVMENDARYVVFLYKTNCFTGELRSSSEGHVFWMPLGELKKAEPLWHLDKMLYIFLSDKYSELYLDPSEENWIPVLK